MSVSQRKAWQKFMGCKPYICPICKRDKGMLYLFPTGEMRYICFCGRNVDVRWINDSYDFDKKKFIKSEEQVKESGSVNKSLSTHSLSKSQEKGIQNQKLESKSKKMQHNKVD